MLKCRHILFLMLIMAVALVIPKISYSQDSIKPIPQSRLIITEVSAGALYVGSMAVLDQLWYKDQFRSYFAWQDDIGEWKQMDKCGHAFTAYYEGYYGITLLESAGMSHNKAIWYGGLWGILMQYPIEVFDGFSNLYGASPSDLAANTVGTALVIGQELAWNDQKIVLKFSDHPSTYAKYRPNELGSTLAERLIKDYNGQTYWLGTGLYNFAPKANIPKWLNITFGYGAEGMIGAYNNQFPNTPNFPRYRQYYLSLDVNLFKIKTRSKFVNTVLSTIGFIKIPAPTLEYDENGKWAFHVIYF